jgi:Domain of unknown function (DUF1840)
VDETRAIPLDAVDVGDRESSMIVNFSTRFDRLTMFAEPALALLGMLGHSARVPGAILAAELPAALARLRAALDESGHVPSPAPVAKPDDEEGQAPRDPSINLATRAVPLVAMMERAIAGGSDMMWDRG